MGYTPRQVGQMSLWEFGACFAGWKRANTPADHGPKPPTQAQHEAAMEFAATLH